VHLDAGPRSDLLERLDGDEGIVARRQDEGGDADGVDEGERRRFAIIFLRVAETPVRSSEHIVELAQDHACRKGEFRHVGEILALPGRLLHQIVDVKRVIHWLMRDERRAGQQVDGRRHRDHTRQVGRRGVGCLAGVFQNDIAAQRKADKRDRRMREGACEAFHDNGDVARATGAIEFSREAHAGAGAAQVDAEHAPAARAQDGRHARVVAGLIGTAQTVHHERDRLVLGSLRARRRLVEHQTIAVGKRHHAALGACGTLKARQQGAQDRLHVRVAQKRQRSERRQRRLPKVHAT
jgi:hypothetical protein